VATVATIVVTVLVIVATVMTLSLTLATIKRGTRRSKGRWGKSVVGVECLRERRRCVGPCVISSKTRLSQPLWKDENGVLRVMMA
jgi:hypothetical protein